MPTCAVIGCKSRGGMPDRKLFRFPMLKSRKIHVLNKSKARQIAWLNALRREDFLPQHYANARVCDLHFISGIAARLKDSSNPDWIPTLNLGYDPASIHIQTNPQFSSPTDAQIVHFITGMTTKLQDLNNPEWNPAFKLSNNESIDISYESDPGQLDDSVEDDFESTFSYSANGIANGNQNDNDHNFEKNAELKTILDPRLCSCHFDGSFDYPIPHYLSTKRTSTDQDDEPKPKYAKYEVLDEKDEILTPSLSLTEDSIKSAEVFRNKNGQFSFLCSQCNTFSENCDELFDHINSHYDSTDLITYTDVEMLESPETLPTLPEPEFISCNLPPAEIKMEPELEIENNESETEVLNIKSEVLSDSEDVGSDQCKILYTRYELNTSNSQQSPYKYQLQKDLHKTTTLSNHKDVTDISNVTLPTLRIGQTNLTRLSNSDAPKTRPKLTNAGQPVLRKILPAPAPITDKYQLKHEKDLKRFLTISKDRCKPIESSSELKLIKLKTLSNRVIRNDVSTISSAKLPDDLNKPNKTKGKCSDCDLEPSVTNECGPRRHGCTDCNLWFSNHFDYRTHSEEKHEKGTAAVRCYQCEMEPRVLNKSDPRRHICIFCHEWFSDHIKFQVHFKDIHDKDADEFFSTLSNHNHEITKKVFTKYYEENT